VLYEVFTEYCNMTGAKAPPRNSFSDKLMESYPSIAGTNVKRSSAEGQEPCYRGVRLNDNLAAKVYKVDPQMIALGFEPARALLNDAHGWPVVNSGAQYFEP
jgi:hypothetical protein